RSPCPSRCSSGAAREKRRGVCELERVANRVADEARKHPAAFPELHLTSSEKGMGIEALRVAVIEDALGADSL
ncbi:MAG: hypothetical protein AAFR64_14600, partial [Pseudomonadota bacterium]